MSSYIPSTSGYIPAAALGRRPGHGEALRGLRARREPLPARGGIQARARPLARACVACPCARRRSCRDSAFRGRPRSARDFPRPNREAATDPLPRNSIDFRICHHAAAPAIRAAVRGGRGTRDRGRRARVRARGSQDADCKMHQKMRRLCAAAADRLQRCVAIHRAAQQQACAAAATETSTVAPRPRHTREV